MTTTLAPVSIEGVAFWAPQVSRWDVARAVMRGEKPLETTVELRPTPGLLPPTERRRAPDTVVVALEVAARACEAAGRTPSSLPAVFASTYGDLAISDYMCATLAATPTLLSPIKFHNSVHNAAAGYWSIGTASRAPYTVLSADQYTFAVGLLEAVTQAACEGGPVLYVAFDVEAKGPLATVVASRGLLGVALVIGPQGSERCQHSLEIEVVAANASHCSRADSAIAHLLAQNALAPCLPFFEGLASPRPGAVTLRVNERASMQIRIS